MIAMDRCLLLQYQDALDFLTNTNNRPCSHGAHSEELHKESTLPNYSLTLWVSLIPSIAMFDDFCIKQQ